MIGPGVSSKEGVELPTTLLLICDANGYFIAICIYNDNCQKRKKVCGV